MTNDPLKFYRQPELRQPSLVVGWNSDIGKLGSKVTGYLNKKLKGEIFAEIEPFDFFPFRGVVIEDNVIQFPESRFFAASEYDLVIFQSDIPVLEWYKFLNLLLDAAENNCRIKEVYAVGGMVSPGAHTSPRQITATFNSIEFKRDLDYYNFAGEINYETPGGQRPTFNSCLLWAGQKRNLPCMTLWVPIPFYLVTVGDPGAQKMLLEFFNHRLNLEIDLSDLDEDIRKQNARIFELRTLNSEIDESISKLESNLRLSDEENQNLITEIERFMKEKY